MRKAIMIIAAMLTLFGGRAMAQRCLPGMSAVEIKADMADGFYTGNSRNCGYSFGVFYSVYKGSANIWSFGGEYLQTYKPYGAKGRIPVAQFTGEVGRLFISRSITINPIGLFDYKFDTDTILGVKNLHIATEGESFLDICGQGNFV